MGLAYSAREIQAQEGLTTPGLWGPPASGGSTPLRETIPESPSQDGFPDFVPPPETSSQSTPRRARAGTVPSRFSPGNGLTGLNLTHPLVPKTSRPTPSTSPFRPVSAAAEVGGDFRTASSPTTSNLLSRLRAGSMPQRSSVTSPASPFGASVFSTPWGLSTKERSGTLSGLRSQEGPDSPGQSSFSRDSLADADVKTLDYLGLAETPQQGRNILAQSANAASALTPTAMLQPFLADLASYNRSLNRYRSYSVNAKEKYAEEEDDEVGMGRASGLHSGTLTPSAASAAAALAATRVQIHQHNLAVQAFANQASASRPRARTASILDSPLRNTGRGYLAAPSRLDAAYTASDHNSLRPTTEEELAESLGLLRFSQLPGQPGIETPEENGLEAPTRALWLGCIPTSTTVSSLQAIFSHFGKIESTRVLVQKNCGFVNFESVDSAIRAKALLNGKEIFPGAGAVRIGFAKAPTSSNGTPSQTGTFASPSPDPTGKGLVARNAQDLGAPSPASAAVESKQPGSAKPVPATLELCDLRDDIMEATKHFGASEADVKTVEAILDSAMNFTNIKSEVPSVAEPSQARVHDAPKLREIRKRIDNNAISHTEIEEIAMAMLPESAELSSDYLGNTVVQKLFEFCSEPTKEAMLSFIAPHLAEIGVHKNGTWAAQKIIDVAKTPKQMSMIVENLRPYTVALFLDQYGNNVIQCCLRLERFHLRDNDEPPLGSRTGPIWSPCHAGMSGVSSCNKIPATHAGIRHSAAQRAARHEHERRPSPYLVLGYMQLSTA